MESRFRSTDTKMLLCWLLNLGLPPSFEIDRLIDLIASINRSDFNIDRSTGALGSELVEAARHRRQVGHVARRVGVVRPKLLSWKS